jgi:hypothetical protein
MNLDELQLMWEKDSEIDPDNLHLESLKIPILHSKYYKIYNELNLLYKKAEQDLKELERVRYEYYSGKSDPIVYIEEPFPFKVRDKDSMKRYLESDKKLSNLKLKIEYYLTMIKYCEDIIKTIQNRTFQIKNAVEFMRFTAGYN